MNKNLTVRYEEENFNVSMSAGNADKVEQFINWATAYKRGIYDCSSTITCKTENDFIICRKKAKCLGLIPIATRENLICS